MKRPRRVITWFDGARPDITLEEMKQGLGAEPETDFVAT
jgi:hypothetical protein